MTRALSSLPQHLLAFAVVSAVAACATLQDSTPGKAALASEADAIIREHDLPGMTLAVAGPGGVATAAAGFANLEARQPMSPGSTMLAASIGKTFVAALVLQLVDRGQIGLDDPIGYWLDNRDWFGRLPNGQHITVRHLLQHRSGLPDHVHMDSFAALRNDQLETIDPEDLIALTFEVEPLFFPAEGWAYTDTGYLLLGLILEEVTGTPYDVLVCERLIAPLELNSTGPSNRKDLPGLARGYVSYASGLGLPPLTTDDGGAMLWNPAIEGTGGGLYATSHDLAVWGRAFLSGKIVSDAVYQQAIAGVPASDTDPASLYGLGIAIRTNSNFGAVYGHRGWIPGYVSSLQYYPEHDVAIAFQVNTDIGITDAERPIMRELEDRLAQLVLEDKP